MAPLEPYPAKPAYKEENGYEKLETYDRIVEGNIEEAHTVATQALGGLAAKFDETDLAGFHKLGIPLVYNMNKGEVVPSGLPPYTQINEAE